MKTRENYIKILQENMDNFKSQFGIDSMVLFGSVARGEHTAESDLDIFVQMPAKIFLVIALKQHLEELLGCKVDVVRDHTGINSYLKKEIERDGIRVFSAA